MSIYIKNEIIINHIYIPKCAVTRIENYLRLNSRANTLKVLIKLGCIRLKSTKKCIFNILKKVTKGY